MDAATLPTPDQTRSAVQAIEGHLSRFAVTGDTFLSVDIGISSENNSPKVETVSDKAFYVILHDVSKKINAGTLIRSASAFGCAGIIVRAKKRSEVATFGAHGSDKHVPFICVDFETDVFTYAKKTLKCHVVGVEIKEEAISVSSTRFADLVESYPRVAFVLGNEGTGMHPSVAANCDSFVYIPHFGGGTASLNVAVAGGIIFHRYATCAGFAERQRQGEKFVVDELDVNKLRSLDQANADAKRSHRDAKKASEVQVIGSLNLLDEDEDGVDADDNSVS